MCFSVWHSHLRYDTLAQMLTLTNIHAGSKVLVFETCAGLVLGSVMERMGGMLIFLIRFFKRCFRKYSIFFTDFRRHILILNFPIESFPSDLLYNYLPFSHLGYGSVIQMYPGGGPVRAGVESFGFPSHFHDTLHEFPICHVNALLAGTLDTTAKDPSAGRTFGKLSKMLLYLLLDDSRLLM